MPNRQTALMAMLELWSWQTDKYTDERPTYVVSPAIVEALVGPGTAAHLVTAELAELVEGGLRIKGTRGRIEWLWHERERRRLEREQEHGRAVNGGKARAATARRVGGRFVSAEPPASAPARLDDAGGPAGDPAGETDQPATRISLSLSLRDPRTSERSDARPRDGVDEERRDKDARKELGDRLWAEHTAAVDQLRAEGVGGDTRPLQPQDGGRVELQARIRDYPSVEVARQDCEHVLAVAIADARAQGTQRYLDGGIWRRERFATALRMSLADIGRKRAGPRVVEPRFFDANDTVPYAAGEVKPP